MMVPRYFLYTSPKPPSSSSSLTERNATLIGESDPTPRVTVKKEQVAGRMKPARISSAPPATSSKPVVIPTRTLCRSHRRSKGHTPRIRTISENTGISHNAYSNPPSTAALLAMTSLPMSRHTSSYVQSGRSDFRPALTQIDDDGAMSMDSEGPRYSSSSSSPRSWGMLLSPPNDFDEDTLSMNSDSNTGPLYSMRSLSSESMPSLEADLGSSSSASNPSTPAITIGRRSGSERRPRTLASSASEDCILDHPLLPVLSEFASDSDEAEEKGDAGDEEPGKETGSFTGEARLSTKSKSSFKSNLTASLRILKSAAASFSNFTAPVIRQNDHLAGSLLLSSPQFTDERRPLPSVHIPDPALRRYLNPFIASPAELHSHRVPLSGPTCTASIQLRTYQRALQTSSRKASAPPVFTSHPLSRSSEESFTAATSRHREPRENSDFLRIIVLEMNMRKVGKLSDTSPGRAKLWLPARQGGSATEAAEEVGVPRRWIGTSL